MLSSYRFNSMTTLAWPALFALPRTNRTTFLGMASPRAGVPVVMVVVACRKLKRSFMRAVAIALMLSSVPIPKFAIRTLGTACELRVRGPSWEVLLNGSPPQFRRGARSNGWQGNGSRKQPPAGRALPVSVRPMSLLAASGSTVPFLEPL
jgi:hypothetical protein